MFTFGTNQYEAGLADIVRDPQSSVVLFIDDSTLYERVGASSVSRSSLCASALNGPYLLWLLAPVFGFQDDPYTSISIGV